MNKKTKSLAVALCAVMAASAGTTVIASAAEDGAAGISDNNSDNAGQNQADYDIILISEEPEQNNGRIKIDNVKSYVKNGIQMVPVRQTAEALGFKVSWNQSEKSVMIDNSSCHMGIYIGSDSYCAMSQAEMPSITAPKSFGTAPELIEDITYVPAKMFSLLDYNVRAEGTYIVADAVSDPDAGNGTENGNSDNEQIPNPITEYKSVSEAEQKLNVKINIPAGLKVAQTESVFLIGELDDGGIVQVAFEDGINFRMEFSGGNETDITDTTDISGFYYNYAYTEMVTSGKNKVLVKGDDRDNIKTAAWNDGSCVYSLSFDTMVKTDYIQSLLGW